jgi:hypothetical protein
MRRNYLLTFFLILLFLHSKGQDNNSGAGVTVEGFISNPQGNYIENVHVVNISGNKGASSNRQGQFRINAFPGDTLRFTCIGYVQLKFYIPADRQSPIIPLHVVMNSDTTQIAGVTIYPWPADANALKKAVLAMEDQTPQVPDLKLNDIRYTAAPMSDGKPNITIPGMGNPGLTYTIQGPITALYEAFSKTAKSQRKYQSLVNADNRKVIAAYRYNPEVVKQVTVFKTDKEIQDFMLYCNLQVDFIVNATEYELFKAIYECQIAYNSESKKENGM